MLNAGKISSTKRKLKLNTTNLIPCVPVFNENTNEKEVNSVPKKHSKKILTLSKNKLCWLTSLSTMGKLFFKLVIVIAFESKRKIMQAVRNISVNKKLMN